MKTKKSGSYFGSWSLILFGLVSLPFGGIGLIFIIIGIYNVIDNKLHPTPTRLILCPSCEKKYTIKMWNTCRVKLCCQNCGYCGWMKVIKGYVEKLSENNPSCE